MTFTHDESVTSGVGGIVWVDAKKPAEIQRRDDLRRRKAAGWVAAAGFRRHPDDFLPDVHRLGFEFVE